jgi:hypothetical protein
MKRIAPLITRIYNTLYEDFASFGACGQHYINTYKGILTLKHTVSGGEPWFEGITKARKFKDTTASPSHRALATRKGFDTVHILYWAGWRKRLIFVAVCE